MIQAYVGTDVFEKETAFLSALASQDPIYGLDPAERAAVWFYTDSGLCAQNINTELRSGRASSQARAFAGILQSALRKLPRFEGLVFRRIRVPSAHIWGRTHSVRGLLRWRSFTSCSRRRENALKGNILFVIASKNGRSLQGYARFDYEEEVLFQPSRFRIIERYESQEERFIFHLEEAPIP